MTDWTAIRRAYLPEMDASLLPSDAELPIFPRVVTDFMRKADDPNSDLRQVAQIIETDTNLTCELFAERQLCITRQTFPCHFGTSGTHIVRVTT